MPYKVKRPPKSYDIEVLSLAVQQLGKALQQLKVQNLQLSFRHSILHATCDILQMMGGTRGAGEPPSAETELLLQLQGLADNNRQCLDQQAIQRQEQEDDPAPIPHSRAGSNNSLSSRSIASNTSHCSLAELDEDDTIATARDPLCKLRTAIAKTGQPGTVTVAEDMSLRDLQEDYQNTVTQLAVNIAFLDSPNCMAQTGDGNPLVKIKWLISRHGQVLTGLLMGGKGHLIPQFMMSDVVTGEQKEEHSNDLYDYALQKLALSDAQQQRIQATLNCYQGLLDPIVTERTAIQKQLGLPPGTPNSCAGSSHSGCTSTNASNGTASSTSMSSTAHLATEAVAAATAGVSRTSKVALERQQQAARLAQEQQQQTLARMVKLLKKESMLKCCAWVAIEGCLTWCQLAKLMTCCYPHPASPIAFGQAVDRLLQQTQPTPQQDQQQQQP